MTAPDPANGGAAPASPTPRVLILPGWLGSGSGHWQTRWERAYGDVRVEQHDWQTPRRGDWIARLEDQMLAEPGPAALVAHSLGCHLVAAWAASSRRTHQAVCALLVAPPDLQRADLPAPLTSWRRPLSAAPLPFPATVAASTNDPFCAFPEAQRLAAAWGAECVDLGPHGHVNSDSGLDDWPDGRRLLEALLQRSRHNGSVQFSPFSR